MAHMTTSMHSDIPMSQGETLVLRLKARDETAFEEAFELYKDMVYSLATRLLTDKSESYDVTQDVFLVLFRQIKRFRGECSLKTWLYRVTLNQAANRNRWWRRRFRDRPRTVSITGSLEDQPSLEPVSRDPSLDRQLLSIEAREAIEKGLAKLPFDQRAAVILRDVQHLSYEEIAETAGISVGTVKSRIARGREKLRRVLQRYQPGGQKCTVTKSARS